MTSLVLLEYDAAGIKQPSRSAVAAAQQAWRGACARCRQRCRRGGRRGGEAARRREGADGRRARPGSLARRADGGAAGRAGARTTPTSWPPTTAVGKNMMPRVAALLDVQPISDIAAVVDADTFVRPIYAGNGMATVKSSDAKKVITVRAASFDPVAAEGGNAPIETVPLPASCRCLAFRLGGTVQERAPRTDRRPRGDLRRPRHAEWRKFQASRADC